MIVKPMIADLAYFITERYAIKLRREAGVEAPWSADPVFQSVRFCNVHREDVLVGACKLLFILVCVAVGISGKLISCRVGRPPMRTKTMVI